MLTTDDVLAILRAEPVFSCAGASALTELAVLAHEQRYPQQTLVAGRGTLPTSLWYVAEGALDLGFYSGAGRLAQLPPIAPGSWAPWVGCFNLSPLPHDIWTAAHTRLVAFPAAAVRRLAERTPGVYERLVQIFGDQLRQLITWTLTANIASPDRRLAYLLASICRAASPTHDGPHTLALTQERIAAMGFGSRQYVAQTVAALRDRGLIRCAYGRLDVLSLRGLDDFAVL